MTFELQQLRQVIALAEHGSFVRAAAALHISQPALSRSIQQLEQRFGSQLFTRTGRGAAPTDLGRLYVERARDVLRMADELDREAVSHGHLRTGRVAVGGGPYPAEAVLARAAAAFISQYPAVALRVCARVWDDLARMLRNRELDFFVAETSTLAREPDLEITPLSSPHALYFVARAGHPLAGRSDLDAATILAWPMLSPSRIPPRVLDPLLAAHRRALASGTAPATLPAIEFDAIAPLKRALATSDAVSATMLACFATELETGRLVVLAREPWLHLQYGIVRLLGHPLTQVAERFLEFVREAEQATVEEESRLAQRFGLRQGTRPSRPRRPRKQGGGRRR